jgi:hypothetical protein
LCIGGVESPGLSVVDLVRAYVKTTYAVIQYSAEQNCKCEWLQNGSHCLSDDSIPVLFGKECKILRNISDDVQ